MIGTNGGRGGGIWRKTTSLGEGSPQRVLEERTYEEALEVSAGDSGSP